MRQKDETGQIVFVEWTDSFLDPGWKYSSEIHAQVMSCETVGFLVCETKEAIVLALSRSVGDTHAPYADMINIPKVSIKHRRILPMSRASAVTATRSKTKTKGRK